MPRPSVTVLPDSVFAFDRTGLVPIYRELAARLEAAIISGQLPPGARLDHEAALSEQLGISRPTVSKAIHALVDKGLLIRRRGIGTQVVQHHTLHRRLELSSLWDDLTRLEKKPSTRVLTYERVRPPNEVAQLLGLKDRVEVLHLRRLRLSEGVPLAILQNFLPLRHAGVSREDLEERGLYATLARKGVVVQVGHQSVSATAADHEVASLLEREVGAPLIEMTRTAFDAGGAAVETGTHLYRPDRYTFETTLVRS